MACGITTISWSPPTSTPIGTPQRAVDDAVRDPAAGGAQSILNTAGVGWFSSDRAIREYASEIWSVPTDAAMKP